MGFYDLPKKEREELVSKMGEQLFEELAAGAVTRTREYFNDDDTYMRKNAYLIVARIFSGHPGLRDSILKVIEECMHDDRHPFIQQSAVYVLGEIGRSKTFNVLPLLKMVLDDIGLPVKNALVGALKRMGEKNPADTLRLARAYIHHPDPVLRSEIVHGIELRGRTHPEDILPLLAELQDDPDKKVQAKIIHVLSQISYKKDCLEKVIPALKGWSNHALVKKALKEIVSVHNRYKNFSAKQPSEVDQAIRDAFGDI
nr:HEAT repeat domain-containing protein [Candidatus Sigynarchaeota archaeon]